MPDERQKSCLRGKRWEIATEAKNKRKKKGNLAKPMMAAFVSWETGIILEREV